MPNSGWVLQVHCSLGTTRLEWATRMAMLSPPMNRYRAITEVVGYEGVFHARNVSMHMALNEPPKNPTTDEPAHIDYVFFYDDDVIPRGRHAILRLVSALDQNPDIGVIAGVYPRRASVPEPIVFEDESGGASWCWEDGEIHRVWGVGTGFTVIRLDAVKDIPVPTYKTADGIDMRSFFVEEPSRTDDMFFSALCEKFDVPIYVHGGVICDQMDKDGKMYRIEDARARV